MFFQKFSWKLVKTKFLLFLYVQLTIYQNEKKKKWKYLHVSKLHLLLFLKILEWLIYFCTSTIFPVININWLRSFDFFFICFESSLTLHIIGICSLEYESVPKKINNGRNIYHYFTKIFMINSYFLYLVSNKGCNRAVQQGSELQIKFDQSIGGIFHDNSIWVSHSK